MRGLKAHQDPEAATEGLGGTYFFRNECGTKIGIMKPCDEEPLAPNNPKGFVGRQLGEPGLKPTVRVGEAASREVAAYLLDHDHFARVPHTVMVRMSHPVFHVATPTTAPPPPPSREEKEEQESDDDDDDIKDEEDLPLKLGSLQEFVPHECDTSEMGASRFNVRDVQRIGILDIRLFNTDRHAGNILVRRARPQGSLARLDTPSALADLHFKEAYELIPIDHGFALPEALEPPYFEWQHWPQALMPFGVEELEYIARLDPRADSDLLRRELPGIREESLRLLEISTTLLKRCAAAGLSLSEIAAVVTRPLIGLDDEPSELEKVCSRVREEVDNDVGATTAVAFEEESDEYDDEEDEDYELLSPLQEADDELLEDDEGEDVVVVLGIAAVVVHEAEEEEEEEDGDELDVDGSSSEVTSPGADSASTHFPFDPEHVNITSSDASRQTTSIDDALFSMDEDSGGGGAAVVVKTPLFGSPTGYPIPSRRLPLFTAPSLVVKRSGEMATPGAIVGMSFGSALASTDSLPASYDSGENSPSSSSGGGDRVNSVGSSMRGAFVPMATSFAPGGFATASKTTARRAKAQQHRRQGQRTSSRKVPRARAYPPLMQPRSCAPGAVAVGVFSGLSAEQWEEFLTLFEGYVDEALRSGGWSQSSLGGMNGPAPLMSCPRF